MFAYLISRLIYRTTRRQPPHYLSTSQRAGSYRSHENRTRTQGEFWREGAMITIGAIPVWLFGQGLEEAGLDEYLRSLVHHITSGAVLSKVIWLGQRFGRQRMEEEERLEAVAMLVEN
ncbi:hypothetical protein EV356DRAFT_568866 [Viridothelium virens]|uniref:Uncharacterized protein n=1 Tax=Viridothelium virens TaxID=1048519 RepID=A0A6A6H2J5_VIRVR|nr:hypothetical protein EV356DRAFT_568866 [Viridothelium virens]